MRGYEVAFFTMGLSASGIRTCRATCSAAADTTRPSAASSTQGPAIPRASESAPAPRTCHICPVRRDSRAAAQPQAQTASPGGRRQGSTARPTGITIISLVLGLGDLAWIFFEVTAFATVGLASPEGASATGSPVALRLANAVIGLVTLFCAYGLPWPDPGGRAPRWVWRRKP
jgi:hypothetical protein